MNKTKNKKTSYDQKTTFRGQKNRDGSSFSQASDDAKGSRDERRGKQGERGRVPSKEMPYLAEHLHTALREHLSAHRGEIFGIEELAKKLSLSEMDAKKVKRYLKALAKHGEIESYRGGRFVQRTDSPASLRGKVERGVLQVSPRGHASVQVTPELRIRVSHNPLNGALHGDTVEIRIDEVDRWGENKGEIVGIVEGFKGRLAGWVRQLKREMYLHPDDTRYPWIPLNDLKGAQAGESVVVRVQRDPEDLSHIWADVEKALQLPAGAAGDIERGAALLGLGEFPDDVLEEAQRVAVAPQEAERRGRLDLRHLDLVTIDGEDARDFDDAVCLERPNAEDWRLTVAVADVSHYVRLGSRLDEEAFLRATSVYFPATCLPMLPEALSNGICSLRPLEDRLCMVAIMTYRLHNKKLRLVKTELAEAVMCSKARLTYTQVAEALSGKADAENPALPFLAMLHDLADLTKRLRLLRMGRGSLDFDVPEAKIVFDEQGEVADITRAPRFLSHRLIEECMLQANEAVATYLLEHKIPGLFRVHDAPKQEKVQNFIDSLQRLGVPLHGELTRELNTLHDDDPEGDWDINPRLLADLLHAAQGHPAQRILHQTLLRSMMQASYLAENTGHFGLALQRYLHFTSPIRRYPDLWVHRMLRMHFQKEIPREGEALQDLLDALNEAARHASKRERDAMQAERDVYARYRARLMSRYIGHEMDGTIVSVAPFGFFVELDAHFVEGLVHIRELDGFFQYDEQRMALVDQRSGASYQIGDRLRIQVAAATPERGEIDFRPIQRLSSLAQIDEDDEDDEEEDLDEET
jgi:ribonuclease R